MKTATKYKNTFLFKIRLNNKPAGRIEFIYEQFKQTEKDCSYIIFGWK